MRLFGFEITRPGSRPPPAAKALSPVWENRGGWVPIIQESFAGAWQTGVTVDRNLVLAYNAVFACTTLIASDIAKLRVKVVRLLDGVWREVRAPELAQLLRRPNHYQNRLQFWEAWLLSKLTRGNTYVLKQRDTLGGRVVALYVLDPNRVKVLIADDGSVFYELSGDDLNGLPRPSVIVPAREMIHDRMNCLFHPLIGTSPIYAAGLAATQGLKIQTNSTHFFSNRSVPAGILSAEGPIGDDTAGRLKAAWDDGFSGVNAGKVAVLGDGLKFNPLTMTAEDAQLIEQLKWTAEVVCSTFHVPPYKIGVGSAPPYTSATALNLQYYGDVLQALIEAAEVCLDDGLDLGDDFGTEFDVEGLLRMDNAGTMAVLKEAVGASIMSPNEARAKLGFAGVTGGGSPLSQQQNYSLEALAKRDAKEDPFASAAAAPAPATGQREALDIVADRVERLSDRIDGVEVREDDRAVRKALEEQS